jgi:hypothetical protein
MTFSKITWTALCLTLIFFAAVSTPWPASAALQDENLLAPLPAGFKVGFRTTKALMDMSEFVPTDETVDDWSSMITVQIFHNMHMYNPETFATNMSEKWKSACTGGSAQKIRNDIENGYPISLWMFLCPLNPQTKKPENMWLKVISGQDSLYAVQYAYRKELAKELITPAMQYLRQPIVCDTRTADHPCPAGMK